MVSIRMPRSTALLVGDADLAVGEVAQPAVHQLARPARGAEGQVVGVDRQHRQPAAARRRAPRRRRSRRGRPRPRRTTGRGRPCPGGSGSPGHGASARASRWRARRRGRPRTPASSTMVCALSDEAVGGRAAAPRAIGSGSPARISPAAWPSPIRSTSRSSDRLLGAAAPREQVGQQQLGVELDDPHEQLVVAQRPDRRDHLVDQSGQAVARGGCAATTSVHSRVIRSPSRVGMSGQAR